MNSNSSIVRPGAWGESVSGAFEQLPVMTFREFVKKLAPNVLLRTYFRILYWRQQRIVRKFSEIYFGHPLRGDLTRGETWQDGGTTWLGVAVEKRPARLRVLQEPKFL